MKARLPMKTSPIASRSLLMMHSSMRLEVLDTFLADHRYAEVLVIHITSTSGPTTQELKRIS